MREILFRGKQVDNGKWAVGSLSTEYYKECGCVMVSPTSDECFKVDPETVGQYTGLTDKNGIKIFEGDILEGDLEANLDLGAKWRSVVVMGKFGWMADDPTGSEPTPLDEFDIIEGEVIGNIHDNPDLLEENKWN